MCSVYESATFKDIFTQHSYLVNETLSNIIVPNTIGEKIKKLRHDLNIIQLQFAKSIHRGFSTITKWEQELTAPSKEAINDIISSYSLEKNPSLLV